MPRSAILPLASGLIFSILLLHFLHGWRALPKTAFGPAKGVDTSVLLERQSAFWRSFYPSLVKYGPTCEPLVHPEDTHLEIFYNASDTTLTRPELLNMTASQVLQLRTAHSEFIAHLKSEDYLLPALRYSRGIVTTAGGSYLPVTVVSVRMLRETGSQLPVEVFLASQDEWDSQICDVVLPAMDARCVVLKDIYQSAGQDDTSRITKYQYKIMAVVFSSFEEVLFLDSDCFPIFDPTDVFDSEPFRSTGLILWPDFWFPSESPLYFEIAGISPPAMNARPSTESGEIFYSKRHHSKSLLLALYYNYYGPDFYYPLQSQGAPGEGDKETFFWSTVVFNEPIYTVKKGVGALGYMTTKGEWRGSAMVQHDPRLEEKEHSWMHSSSAQTPETPLRPLFIHANFPKLDPATIFLENAMGASGPTQDADGTMRRIWRATEAEAIDFFGFDLERRLWHVIRSVACEYEHSFTAWKDQTGVCTRATRYWQALFASTRRAGTATN